MRTDSSQDIPGRNSSAAEWIQWHRNLLSDFSKDKANTYFLEAWNLRAGKSSNANTDTLRAYLKTKGIEIDKTLLASYVDTAEGVFDKVRGIFNFSRTASIIVGVGILIPVVMLLVNIARNPVAVAGAVGGAVGHK